MRTQWRGQVRLLLGRLFERLTQHLLAPAQKLLLQVAEVLIRGAHRLPNSPRHAQKQPFPVRRQQTCQLPGGRGGVATG